MSMSDVIGTNRSGTAAEEIGAAAARLARDAIAAAAVGGMAPPTAPPTAPVPAPMIPSAAGQQVDVPLPTGMTLPSGLLQPHGLPQQPREAAPATHHHSVERGTTDWTGLRRFVSQVRGLDHRQSAPLPAWQGAGLQSAAGVPATAAAAGFDVDRVRLDFPILQERIHGHPLAWFDNAATTHKPQAVIDALARFYVTDYALLHHATRRLEAIDKLRLVGTARDKVGVLSFVLAGHDPVAIGQRLDRAGIAVRAGHHCAQPSLRHFGLEATVRPSLAFYNTVAEIDRLADVVAGIAAG